MIRGVDLKAFLLVVLVFVLEVNGGSVMRLSEGKEIDDPILVKEGYEALFPTCFPPCKKCPSRTCLCSRSEWWFCDATLRGQRNGRPNPRKGRIRGSFPYVLPPVQKMSFTSVFISVLLLRAGNHHTIQYNRRTGHHRTSVDNHWSVLGQP
ncbi:hypothetical protein FHG87_007493 [Trinorchestia longiramus]|nr:hypothetical protein FHG87_007493 [Trinorchestia longiramus]